MSSLRAEHRDVTRMHKNASENIISDEITLKFSAREVATPAKMTPRLISAQRLDLFAWRVRLIAGS